MANDRQRTTQRVDGDGVRVFHDAGVRTGVWLLVLAIGLVGLAVFLLVRTPQRGRSDKLTQQPRDSPRAPAAGSASIGSSAGAPRPAPVVRLEPRPPAPDWPRTERNRDATNSGDPTPGPDTAPGADAEPAAGAGAEPAAGQEAPMFEMGAPGEGIAAFPPPGTKPIKRGLVVPDGFELPPGFVRHYQTTDEGQQLPPILMFHPDYQPVDEHGAAIALPANRVVPPELAPPGMPRVMRDVPETHGQAADAPGPAP